MSVEEYWVGERSDSAGLWLYDQRIQHDDPAKIYAFDFRSRSMREYPRELARDKLQVVTDGRRDDVVAAYREWFKLNGDKFVELEREKRRQAEEQEHARLEREEKRRATEKELRQRIEQQRRDDLPRRHRAYLERHGFADRGVICVEDAKHRTTQCWYCGGHLDSTQFVACTSCRWLICYCGACGCGYSRDRAGR